MTEKNLDTQKNQIQKLGLNAIKEFFEIPSEKIDGINKETINMIHQKAKIGMQFEKEMNVSKRAVEMNYLRVFRMVAEDKKELKSLIKKSIPNYLTK